MKKPARNERAFLEIDPATTYFPTPERCSIIGSNTLNYRVRDGNGCTNGCCQKAHTFGRMIVRNILLGMLRKMSYSSAIEAFRSTRSFFKSKTAGCSL